VNKTCKRCGGKFREPASEPFVTCPGCRLPDPVRHHGKMWSDNPLLMPINGDPKKRQRINTATC
jgi:hypothetical protein